MEFRRTTAPITRAAKLDILPLVDVKEHIRIAHDFEDRLLEGFVATAYDFLAGPDGWLGYCCLLPEGFECFAGALNYPVELPMRPLMPGGIQSVSVTDADGAYSPVDPTFYRELPGDPFSSLVPYMGTPQNEIRRNGLTGPDPLAYKINFVAGFGATPDLIPEPLVQAMKMLVGHWYQNREQTFADVRISTVSREVEFGMRALAGRYRIEPDHS